jgi:hypothetical protein
MMPFIHRDSLIINAKGEMRFREADKPRGSAPPGDNLTTRKGPPGVLVRSQKRLAKPDTGGKP